MPLDTATLERLAAIKNKPKPGTYAPSIGPLRYIEVEKRCSSRGCGSMTHYTVQGAPKCTVHALDELNEMLISRGARGIVTDANNTARPTPIPIGRIVCASVRYRLDVGFAASRYECIHGINLEEECRGCEWQH
jgi:hypothetical protein